MLKNVTAMVWFELVWIVYLYWWKGADITSWVGFWQETLGVSAVAIGLWIVTGVGMKVISRGERLN